MNKATKLTLAELLRRKEQMIASKKIKKTMDLYIKSIDSVITIEEPDGALCRDANDMEAGEGDKVEGSTGRIRLCSAYGYC